MCVRACVRVWRLKKQTMVVPVRAVAHYPSLSLGLKDAVMDGAVPGALSAGARY